MDISPDTKDWSWVTTRACKECGFDPDQISIAQIPDQIKSQLLVWPEILNRPNISERLQRDQWSALEYGAHVRDVLIVMRGRLKQMLAQDNPDLLNWDQDQAAIDGKYRSLNSALLADEIGIEGQMLANHYAHVTDEQGQRPGQRTDGSQFTVLSLGKYLLHELVHHAWDVQGASATGRQGD